MMPRFCDRRWLEDGWIDGTQALCVMFYVGASLKSVCINGRVCFSFLFNVLGVKVGKKGGKLRIEERCKC